jgi:isocitrate dehydrogenase
MQLILDQWINPHLDTSRWEFYDLSCASRDRTNDKVLQDAVSAGKRIGSIFKEPTITPTAAQVQSMGLKKSWPSPNGLMRRGWNGITISRDTIHIVGVELGFKRPVVFDRHATGGEYGAAFKHVGPGRVVSTFTPAEGGPQVVIDDRRVTDKSSSVVVYDNPHDNLDVSADPTTIDTHHHWEPIARSDCAL